MTVQVARACWCGGELDKEVGRHYRCCSECGAAVLAVLPAPSHFEVSDDERDFYGRHYWTDYSRARDLPDICARARSDLSERCLFWLDRLLEVTHPPGRALEIGCGHGGFVGLMKELGFDAAGTELSPWVEEFAKRTFDVPVLLGRLETLAIEPGLKCIAAFDVLEHVSDPLETVRRCGDLLELNGVLLLQTPWYRGEGADWSMFQPDEHIYLFTEESIRLLLARAGFREVVIRPSLFPYDMWIVATRGRLHMRTAEEVDAAGDWRRPIAFRALLDLSRKIKAVRECLATAEADRAARLIQVGELTGQVRRLEVARREDAEARREDVVKLTALLRGAEEDGAVRLAQVEELTAALRESNTDRAARLAQVEDLTGLLRESNTDRAARLAQVEELTRLLRESNADRAARLAQVEELTGLLRESNADRAARLAQVEELTGLLRESNADRAARLAQVEELTGLLRGSDADRAARLAHVEELTGLLRESDADRAARLAHMEELTGLLGESNADRAALRGQIAEIKRTWAWRLHGALASSATRRRPVE